MTRTLRTKGKLCILLLVISVIMLAASIFTLNTNKASAAESYTAMDESNLPSEALTLVQTAKDQDKYAEFTIKNVSSGSNWQLNDKSVLIAFDEAVKPDGTVLAPNFVYTGDDSTKAKWIQNRGKIVYNGYVNAAASVGGYPIVWNAQYATPWQEEAYKNGDSNILCLNLSNLSAETNNMGAFSDTETQELKLLKGFTIVDREGNAFVLKEDYTFYRKNGFFTTASDITNVVAAATYNVKPTAASIVVEGSGWDAGKTYLNVSVTGDSIGNIWTHGCLAYADLDKVKMDGNSLQGLIWGGQLGSNTAFPLMFKNTPTFTDGQELTFEEGATFMWRGSAENGPTNLYKVVVSETVTLPYNSEANKFGEPVEGERLWYLQKAKASNAYSTGTFKYFASASAWMSQPEYVGAAAYPVYDENSPEFDFTATLTVGGAGSTSTNYDYIGNKEYIYVNDVQSTKDIYKYAARNEAGCALFQFQNLAEEVESWDETEGAVNKITLKKGFLIAIKEGESVRAFELSEDCTVYCYDGYVLPEETVEATLNGNKDTFNITNVSYNPDAKTLQVATDGTFRYKYFPGSAAYISGDKITVNGDSTGNSVYVSQVNGESTFQLILSDLVQNKLGKDLDNHPYDTIVIKSGFTMAFRLRYEISQNVVEELDGFYGVQSTSDYTFYYYNGEFSTAKPALITGIECALVGKPKVIKGEQLNLQVYYLYDDATRELSDITVKAEDIAGFDSDTVGTKEVTVTLTVAGKSFSDTFEVEVIENYAESYEAFIDKIEYEQGEELDEVTVVATMYNGTTLPFEDFVLVGYDKDEVGEQTILVKDNEGNELTSFVVTVSAKSDQSSSDTTSDQDSDQASDQDSDQASEEASEQSSEQSGEKPSEGGCSSSAELGVIPFLLLGVAFVVGVYRKSKKE